MNKAADKVNLRAMGEYEIVNALQVPEIKELMECLINKTEKAEFAARLLRCQTRDEDAVASCGSESHQF